MYSPFSLLNLTEQPDRQLSAGGEIKVQSLPLIKHHEFNEPSKQSRQERHVMIYIILGIFCSVGFSANPNKIYF